MLLSPLLVFTRVLSPSPRNANAERAAAALRSPWHAISSGPSPRPRWIRSDSVTPTLQPCPEPWHPPSSVGQCQTVIQRNPVGLSPRWLRSTDVPALQPRQGCWRGGSRPPGRVSSWFCSSIPRVLCFVCSSGISGRLEPRLGGYWAK